MIDEHPSNQSAQSGEDDAHKYDQPDQVDQSDQPAVVEDSAAVTRSEATTAAASQSASPEDSQEIRGCVASVTDQLGEEKEICLLPEKTQDPFDVGDHGGDLDDLSDPSDLSKKVPNKEEEKPGTLPPRQEEDTSKGRFGVKFW